MFFHIGPKNLIFLIPEKYVKRQKMVKKWSKKGQKRGFAIVENMGGFSGGFFGRFFIDFGKFANNPLPEKKMFLDR